MKTNIYFYHISLTSSYKEKYFRPSCRETKNTHFIFNKPLFENRAVYEIMWKNIVEPERPQMTIGRMLFVFCVTKTTNTLSEYVILIALLLPQYLQKRASVLRYTYIACLVFCGLLILIRVSCCISVDCLY